MVKDSKKYKALIGRLETCFGAPKVLAVETADSAIQKLYAYYTTLKERGVNPQRSDFSLLKLKAASANFFVLDVISDLPEFKVAYMGSTLDDMYGYLTNQSYKDVVPEEIYERTTVFFEIIAFTEEPLIIATNNLSERKEYISSQTLIIPLFDEAGQLTKAIGLVVRHG
ncbi:PAS domain-containing protein [Temperatibacter marinus]|uniref:PAS domain-containing protein n=1 Tax=Temperatibacter marinus TaxID=1456591 RepID=A0AA52EFD8_9PROT|nr:PAS domain-containing protein [Temperatibacter marinus]WND03766.1 PAS domain-containing protein [Temperatibacter marinus]